MGFCQCMSWTMANMSLSAYGKYSHSWIHSEDYLSKLLQLSLQVGIKHLQLFLLKSYINRHMK